MNIRLRLPSIFQESSTKSYEGTLTGRNHDTLGLYRVATGDLLESEVSTTDSIYHPQRILQDYKLCRKFTNEVLKNPTITSDPSRVY